MMETSFVIFLLFFFRFEYTVKKEGWQGGRQKVVEFHLGNGDLAQFKRSGKCLHVTIGQGLPKDSRKYYIA